MNRYLHTPPLPPVVKNLLIINTLVYMAKALLPIGPELLRFGALSLGTPWYHSYQYITYMFLHANLEHLFFNMFALWMFGMTMERVLGAPKFLFYYISCGLGAALVQEGVFAGMISHYASMFANPGAVKDLLAHSQVMYNQLYEIGVVPTDAEVGMLYQLYHTPTIGASGAVFGILLAFGYMFPQARLSLLFPPVTLKARTFVLIYAAIELVLGVYNNQADTVAHFAHLGGMLFGLAILLYWRKKGVIGGPYHF